MQEEKSYHMTPDEFRKFNRIRQVEGVDDFACMRVDPRNKDVIYVANTSLYKSTDAGRTWTHIGLDKSERIARIVIDSKNPELVYACGLGREWGPSEERGVFKSADGGKSWK